MQRAVIDLLGLHPSGAATSANGCAMRPGRRQHPLRKSFDANAVYPPKTDAYPFVSVSGDGVHEIPVGRCMPAHRPGHFRFPSSATRAAPGTASRLQSTKGIEKTLREHES